MGSRAHAAIGMYQHENQAKVPRQGVAKRLGRKVVAMFGDKGAGAMATGSVITEKVSQVAHNVSDRILGKDPLIARRRAVGLGILATAAMVVGVGAAKYSTDKPDHIAKPQVALAEAKPVPHLLNDEQGPWGLSRRILISHGNIDPTAFEIDHYNDRLVADNGLPQTSGPDRQIAEQWVEVPEPLPIEICAIPQDQQF